jgi:hypothetical protein
MTVHGPADFHGAGIDGTIWWVNAYPETGNGRVAAAGGGVIASPEQEELDLQPALN